MSVNKPTKFDLPKDPGESAGEKPARGSLFERASGAFGLDKLGSAPPPAKLADDRAKKFAPKRAAPAAAAVAPAAVPPVAAPVAGPAPAAVAAEPAKPVVRLAGEKHPVPRALLREQGLIDPDGGSSTLLEEFRIVKRQVLASAKADTGPLGRRVLVCSPHPGEGKTFCALNLALAMAGERDTEVLLVDADFAKPSILARLGLEGANGGLMEVLADPASFVEDRILATDIPGLWVLPAGERTGRDAEYLASARTADVLDRLTRGAPNRIVIFDSPPALAASPAAELAKHVGQALLVARADMTGKTALEDAIDLLSACPDIKLLLNDATFSPSGRRFGSYYGYGE